MKKVFLEISQNLSEPFFNKVAGLRLTTLLKQRLWHSCFPVNFAKFLRIPFLTEHLRWLLLRFRLYLEEVTLTYWERMCLNKDSGKIERNVYKKRCTRILCTTPRQPHQRHAMQQCWTKCIHNCCTMLPKLYPSKRYSWG